MERDTTGANANICGRAGEHLVCAEFLAEGYECWIVEGKAQYDLVADIGGKLLRIQVKTTAGTKACPQRKHHTPVYMWNARRYGKGGRQAYAKGDADIIAYVALDRKMVAYMPADRVAQSMNLRLRELADQYVTQTGMFLDDYPLAAMIERLAA
jgi:hypothetical protein